jgi:transposase
LTKIAKTGVQNDRKSEKKTPISTGRDGVLRRNAARWDGANGVKRGGPSKLQNGERKKTPVLPILPVKNATVKRRRRRIEGNVAVGLDGFNG